MNGVYRAISRVTAELAKDGIGKNRKNQQQGFNFRGIDDVYNALAAVLAANQLSIMPRVLNRTVTERQAKGGGVLFSVVVEAEFDFIYAEDGSTHTVKMFGEAMDSGDKATSKALSAAYKYACLQAFCIPTEGDNDADATTHELATGAKPQPQQAKPAPQNTASQPPAKAVFAAEAELILFQTGVRRDFAQAMSPAALDALAKRDREVVERLFNSPVDVERNAAKALAADYGDRLKELQAAKPKPAAKTVEDVLGADDIPF